MPAPVQLRLPIRDPRYRRPVMTIDTLKGVLDCTEDEIIELLEVQLALVAWNIATPGAERRELRIHTQSVSDYLPHRAEPCYHTMLAPDAAALELLPHDKPFLTGVEIQRALNCGSTHVINLVEARCLDLVPKTDYQRGPGGSPSITRESFLRFLNNRIVC